MKTCYGLFILLLCSALGCSMERITLQDINPSRTYKTTVPAFFDEVRLFSIHEGFRLERFEQESGRIIGHKNLTVSSSEAGMLPNAATSKRIVMILKIRPNAERETSVDASFVYGGEQIVLTRSDEEELVSCYKMLFKDLDEKFAPEQTQGPK